MDEIIDRIVADLKSEQSKITDIMTKRGAQNHSEYSYLCGKIEAYESAIAFLVEEKKQYIFRFK